MIKSFHLTKNRILIILSSILFLCLSFFGLNFYFHSASADYYSGFEMLEGMSLSLTFDSLKGRVRVYVPNEIKDILCTETTSGNVLFWTNYYPSPYCISLVRYDVNNVSDIYETFYHIDPEHFEYFSCQNFIFDDNICYLSFDLPSDYSKTYRFYCNIYGLEQVIHKKDLLGTKSYTTIEPVLKYTTSNYTERSVSYVASKTLENDSSGYNSLQIRYLQHLAGVNISTETFNVNLKYKKSFGIGDIRTVSESFLVNSTYATCSSLVYTSICDIKGIKGIFDFNCIYENIYTFENGYIYKTDKRIALQAESYSYSFDSNSNTGTLTITYRDFAYKDFAIEVRDNDLTNGQFLTLYIYPVDISSVDGGRFKITYNYADIVEQCFSSVGWIFNLEQNNFSVSGEVGGVLVEKDDNNLYVYFNPASQNDLTNLRVQAIAEIIPDYNCSVIVEYVELSFEDKNIVENLNTLELDMLYSDYIMLSVPQNLYNYRLDNSSTLGSFIESALYVRELGGVSFYNFSSGEFSIISENVGEELFKIEILYTYNTIVRFLNNLNDSVYFSGLTQNTLIYNFSDFNFSVPNGYRVANLVSDDTYKLEIDFNDRCPFDSSMTLKMSAKEKEVLSVYIELSDEWYCDITYFERFKDSPFFEKKVDTKIIKVSDYSNIYEISAVGVKNILGKEILDLLGLSTVESVEVVFNEQSTYNIVLHYTETSLRKTNYDGSFDEVKVPLTAYSAWTESFGKDWSILMLNDSENHYFKYANDVNREDLYGFFSVAVFQERVSNLNYYLQQYSANGCITAYTSKEISGSSVYKFFGERNLKAFMAFCEFLNRDDSLYYSYFFYLDGGSDMSYLALNGADSYDDTDTALKNRIQDVGETFQKVGETISNWWNNKSFLSVAIKIVIGVIVAFIVLWFLIKLGKALFRDTK